MGATKPEKADKKEKKDKKRAEADGVTKPKKDKKEKKDKKDKLKSAVANAELDETLQADAAASVETAPAVTEMEVEQDGVKEKQVVVGALVPFARPLADDKAAKKVLKSVRKGTHACIPHFPFASYLYSRRHQSFCSANAERT